MEKTNCWNRCIGTNFNTGTININGYDNIKTDTVEVEVLSMGYEKHF